MGLHFNADDEKFKQFFKLTAGEKQENTQIDSYFEQYAREYGLTKDELTEAFNVSIWAPSLGDNSDGGFQFSQGMSTSDVGNSQIEDLLSNARQRRIVLGISNENKKAMGDLSGSDNTNRLRNSEQLFLHQKQSVDASFGQAYTEQQHTVSRTEAEGKRDVSKAKREVQTEQTRADLNNQTAIKDENRASFELSTTQNTGNKRIADAKAIAASENERMNTAYTLAQGALASAEHQSENDIAAAKNSASQKNKQAQNELTSAQSRKSTAESAITSLESGIAELDKDIKRLSEELDNPNATEDTLEEYNKALEQKRKASEELEKQEKELKEAAAAVNNAETKVKTTASEGETSVSAAEIKGKVAVSSAQTSVDMAFADMQITEQNNNKSITAVTTEVNKDITVHQASLAGAQSNTKKVAGQGEDRVADANNALKKQESNAERNTNREEQRLAQLQRDWDLSLNNARIKAEEEADNPDSGSVVQNLAELVTNQDVADKLRLNVDSDDTVNSRQERLLNQNLADVKRQNSATFNPLGTNPKAKIETTAKNLYDEKNDELAIKEPDNNQSGSKKRTFGI